MDRGASRRRFEVEILSNSLAWQSESLCHDDPKQVDGYFHSPALCETYVPKLVTNEIFNEKLAYLLKADLEAVDVYVWASVAFSHKL